MKPDLAMRLAAITALILASAGCGGISGSSIQNDAEADSATPATGGMDASMPFNPGAIGGLIGGMGVDAGSGTMGRDSGSTAMPSPRVVVDGCNDLCTKSVAASCPATGTLDSCLVGCRVMLANANCASAAQNLFSCVKTSTASCDASGNVVFSGCQVSQLAAGLCFLQNADDPTVQAPCAAYCAAVTAAKCPNDNPAGCQGGCQIIGNLVSGCGTLWKNYVACANGSTLSCGANGKASAPACLSQALLFLACTTGGLATILSDAGQ